MSLLNSITTGQPQFPGLRIVIAGVEGIGKTHLAAGAPDCLFIPLEVGYAGLKNVAKIPQIIPDYLSFVNLILEIRQKCQDNQFPYRCLVFDSATALERLIHESVLMLDPAYKKGTNKSLTMETALGGYGKAYALANERFIEIMKILETLAVYFHRTIVFTCHVFASKVIDPNAGEYDSWDLLLHSPKNQKTYGKREYMTQWADLIGFLYEPVTVIETHEVKKAVSNNQGRILGCSRTPSFVAKNRFNITQEIPIPIENSWNHLAHAIYTGSGIDIYNRPN